MRNIKEIKKELATLRAEYDAKVLMLEKEIQDVRAVRGYIPRQAPFEDYYEMGRSKAPTNGWN